MNRRILLAVAGPALALLLVACLCSRPSSSSQASQPTAGQSLPPTRQLRRPVALALTPHGLLVVANRDSGTVSVVPCHGEPASASAARKNQLTKNQLTSETRVGQRLSGLALLPQNSQDKPGQTSAQGSLVLVTDVQANELIVCTLQAGQVRPLSRLALCGAPVNVIPATDGRRAFVAALWGRQLHEVNLENPQQPRLQRSIDLPLSPRLQALSPEGNSLLVADSFTGRIAVVDLSANRFTLQSIVRFPGHNIRGLTFTPDGQSVLAAHQLLYERGGTTSFSVHWGSVLANVVRTLPTEELHWAVPSTDGTPTEVLGTLDYLGTPDRAAGDPGAIIASKKRRWICLSGVSEVAASADGIAYRERTEVGHRPVALAWDSSNNQLYVANMFEDSVSVLDAESLKVLKTIRLGPSGKLTPVTLGEMLFYDARLARDGWYSCHSCHPDGHTNEGRTINFGNFSDDQADPTYQRTYAGGDHTGPSKRVLSLLGVGQTGPWAWNGQVSRLETQVKKSLEVTLQGPPASKERVDALTAFLKTLPAAPSVSAARGELDISAIQRGQRVFTNSGCADCHHPEVFTSEGAYDVGLADEAGHSQFNPPSLRGLSQRERFFHDNRAGNLTEVLQLHQPDVARRLSPAELRDLLIYLQSR